MKINCSGGKGVMELQDCFACALEGENICGYDYALIKEMMSDQDKEERRNSIHVTDLTGCLRRAYYDKKEPAAEYIHETLARWLGTNFHHAAENQDELFDSELLLSHNGIVGRSDLVYKNGRIVDYKFVRWMYVDRLPYGSHALQLNIYGYMLRKQGRPVTRLQVQYVDASGPTKCKKCKVPVRMYEGELKCPNCFQYIPNAHLGAYLCDIPIMSDEEVEANILHRKEELEASLALGMPPAREPGYLCAYCAHAQKCCPDMDE